MSDGSSIWMFNNQITIRIFLSSRSFGVNLPNRIWYGEGKIISENQKKRSLCGLFDSPLFLHRQDFVELSIHPQAYVPYVLY